MGHAAIAQVVVHAAAAASLLLGRIAHALHIAVVVVGPDKRDIVRHAQSCIIDVERLLVGHEDLRQFRNLLLFMFREDVALLSEHFLQCAGAVSGVGTTLHGLIVQAAHPHRIDVFILSRLADAVVEFFQDGLAVRLVVPLAVALLAPFRRGGIVEEQRLAVARGDHDAPLVGHPLTLRMTVERSRTSMHGRCKHVALQTEDEFAHAVIGFGANVTKLFLIGCSCPGLQAPVLIVDKDSTIFHAWRLAHDVLLIIIDTPVAFVSRHVGPPIPRTDAYLLADM